MKLEVHTLRALAAAAALLLPATAHAQLKVIMSGGFEAAYRQLLPEFERTTGIKVETGSGGSQGTGPDTIRAQLARGEPADLVILSREGLDELIADGRIVADTEVGLAEAALGAAVRKGAQKPDVSTVDALRRTLLSAKTIAVPGSTSGIYLTRELFPKLGVADRITVKMTARGAQSAAMVAAGEAEIAIQPVSELVPVAGLDFAGPLPAEVQLVQVFSAAVVKGSKQEAAAGRLIAFLASDRAAAAIRRAGMEQPARRR
jgi:molybdate transport system substrate-binding protein